MTKKPPRLDSLSNLTPFITALIAIVAVVIPVAGFSFEQGYLSVFGISSEYFPRAISESWVYSFHISVVGLGTLLKYYPLVCFWLFIGILVLGAIILLISSIFKRETLKDFFQQMDNKRDEGSLIGNLMHLLQIIHNDTFWIINLIFYFGIVLIFIVFITVAPSQYGINLGNKQLEKYSAEKCQGKLWSKCVQIKDIETNVILHEGFMISASDKYVALFDGKVTTVIARLTSHAIVRNKSLK